MLAHLFASMRWLYFVAVSVSFASTLQQQHHNEVYATAANSPCGLEMIWPPPDAVVLMATDSRHVEVYLKLWGNCTEFLHAVTPTRSHLHFAFLAGDPAETRLNPLSVFERAVATPFNLNLNKPCAAAMSSPLISYAVSKGSDCSDSAHCNLTFDTFGRHDKEFSMWFISLVYPTQMLNSPPHHIHNPEDVRFTFEFHLLSNLSTPPANVAVPPLATLNFTSLGRPSSHFYPAAARYSTLPGFLCLSACGKVCTPRTQSMRNYGEHSLRTMHSPVCTPITQAPNWTLAGPSFTLSYGAGTEQSSPEHKQSVQLNTCAADMSCSVEVAVVCIGDASGNEIGIMGSGRHRLLSVIASVMTESVGFILLKTHRARINQSHAVQMLSKYDLISSYAFIAFRHRQFHSLEGRDASEASFPLPTADFGSIDEGILLSRAAAVMMLNAASDEIALLHNETVPAACSEFLVFSDAWLCWCADSLDIPALDVRFGASAGLDVVTSGHGNCTATSPLYGKLVQLYEQQRLSAAGTVSPPFTESTTLGFRYFMQTLAFHLVSGPRILHILDDDDRGYSLFWDACCGQLLLSYMLLGESPPVSVGLHPLLHRSRSALAAAPNRSAFVAVLRDAVVAGDVQGRDILNSSMHAARRRTRMSVSAAWVLGCSVQTFDLANDDLLRGRSGTSSRDDVDPLQLHIITPAVMLSKLSKPVSRRLYLATHADWSSVFGYNPVFSKDASLAFAAPEFDIQDWHLLCMLAVSSKSSAVPASDLHSREYLACNSFASAVWQRTYAAGMPRCFDLPPRVAGDVPYMGSARVDADHLSNCQTLGDEGRDVNDDPWMLRELASAVQALLLERWDTLQV